MNKQRINFLLKGLIGSFIVLIIVFLSKTDNYYIAGLIPLFPSFGILAQIIVYNEKGIEALKETILFGMFSIIPYLLYLLGIYYTIDLYGFFISIIVGIVLWTLSAIILIKNWDRICLLFSFKELIVAKTKEEE